MPGPVTRSRAYIQASPQKVITKKKINLTKETRRKKSGDKATVKRAKQKSIDETLIKSDDIALSKKRISERSKQRHNPQSNKKLTRNYVSSKVSDNAGKEDTSSSEEDKEKAVGCRTRRNVRTKMPKRKRIVLQEENINKSRNKVILRTRRSKKTPVDTNSNFRQISLKESFSNQSKIRPRSILKNTKSDEKPVPSNSKKPKVPVYKTVPTEDSEKNGTEIYEFKFDANDSKERVRKKKKKTTKKTTIRRIKKRAVDKKITKKDVAILQPIEPEEQTSTTNVKTDKQIPISTEPHPVLKEAVQNTADTNNTSENSTEIGDSAVEQSDNIVKKPTIRSIEELRKKISIVKSPTPETDAFKPFRPTNIFNNNRLTVQNRSITNHSLLEKSLSPIAKMSVNFDPGSPWRPPSLMTFSQVKTLFQSTPQPRKYDVSTGKLTRDGNDAKYSVNTVKSKESTQKNNENLENSLNINQKKKKLINQRRFGTEITNLEHSMQSDNPVGQMSDKMIIESENSIKNIPTFDSINTNNMAQIQKKDNRENTILNYQTPKNILKAELKQVKRHSPQKKNILKANVLKENTQNVHAQILTADVSLNLEKENVDPQPGPSGLQTLKSPRDEQRVLRQSNLNDFLNIMDMPENTTIKTRHGIFDDNYSTPVSSKLLKKSEDQNTEIKNAFGFVEDGSDQSITTSTEQINQTTQKTKPRVGAGRGDVKIGSSLRLPARNIRNLLLKKNIQEKFETGKKTEAQDEEIKKSPVKEKNKVQIDIANFSDTFDVHSDTELSEGTSTVPLFVDLEPSHFTQPPKHSYKRKRAVKFNFAGDSDEEEDDQESDEEYQVKRKRTKKMQKNDCDRLQEWIENVNRTFDEIDHYDLLVE